MFTIEYSVFFRFFFFFVDTQVKEVPTYLLCCIFIMTNLKFLSKEQGARMCDILEEWFPVVLFRSFAAVFMGEITLFPLESQLGFDIPALKQELETLLRNTSFPPLYCRIIVTVELSILRMFSRIYRLFSVWADCELTSSLFWVCCCFF